MRLNKIKVGKKYLIYATNLSLTILWSIGISNVYNHQIN